MAIDTVFFPITVFDIDDSPNVVKPKSNKHNLKNRIAFQILLILALASILFSVVFHKERGVDCALSLPLSFCLHIEARPQRFSI
jgi:hypothetical protein